MAVAFVQEASSASSSVTLGANATAGNTLLVAVACLSASPAAGVTGITLGGSADNFANVTPGPSARDTTPPNDYINVSVWADANCAGGSNAIAVTGTGVVACWAYEFSGIAGTADVAKVIAVSDYHDSWMTAASQTTVPSAAWLAVTCAANQAGTETLTVNNVTGWTLETAYNGTSGSYDWGAVSGYQTVNTVGTPAWSGSFSQASFSVTVLVTLGAGTPPAPAVASAPLAANVGVTGALAVQGPLSVSGQITQGGTPVGLTPTGIKTGNYTAKPGDFVPVQAPASTFATITFPSGAATGATVGVTLLQSSASVVTVQAAGSDVFGTQPAGTNQIFLRRTGATFIAQYYAPTGTWYIQSASGTEPQSGQVAGAGDLPGTPDINSPVPRDLGYVTWSYDPASLASPFTGTALTSGKIHLVMCPVRATVTTSATLTAWITSAGSGLTSGQNFAGAYSAAGSLLFASPDMTTTFGSTGQFFGIGTAVAVAPPYVWAAFLSNGTTPPSLARTGSQTTAWANGNLPTNTPRFGTLSGTYTSLPSSFGSAVPTISAAMYFAALY